MALDLWGVVFFSCDVQGGILTSPHKGAEPCLTSPGSCTVGLLWERPQTASSQSHPVHPQRTLSADVLGSTVKSKPKAPESGTAGRRSCSGAFSAVWGDSGFTRCSLLSGCGPGMVNRPGQAWPKPGRVLNLHSGVGLSLLKPCGSTF